VVTQLARGTEVDAGSETGDWVSVETGGRSGFVHRSLLRPLVKRLVTGDRVNLRRGPGTDQPRIALLERGTVVSLEREQQQGDWALVTVVATGRRGWIHRSFLATPTTTAPILTEGKRVMADGTIYIGQFKNGVFHGHGRLIFPDGRRYEGEFREGRIEGYGEMSLAVGGYKGEWKDGKFHGQGTLTRYDGSKLIGRWENNTWTGEGKYVSPTGDVYVGGWKNGLFEGFGTLTHPDGRVERGRWHQGRLVEPQP